MVKEQEAVGGIKWTVLTREVSEVGSVKDHGLGQGLFNLFIYNLELGLSNEVVKFADDTDCLGW